MNNHLSSTPALWGFSVHYQIFCFSFLNVVFFLILGVSHKFFVISLKATLLGAALTSSGNLFHFSVALTENEYFPRSVLAHWTVRLCPPVPSLVLNLSCDASLWNISIPLVFSQEFVDHSFLLVGGGGGGLRETGWGIGINAFYKWSHTLTPPTPPGLVEITRKRQVTVPVLELTCG